MGTRLPDESAGGAVKNSAVISFFNALGSVSVLLLDIVIAATFGLGQKTDAFFIAYTIPRIVMSVLMVATNQVLVPVFSSILLEEGKDRLWRVSSNFANLSLVALGLVALLGSAASPLIMGVFGAGLAESGRELAVSLSRIVFLMIVPVGGAEIFKSLFNALRSFALPAASKIVLNVITMAIVAMYSSSLDIYAVAVGYIVATWVEFFFLIGVLLLKGFRYHLVLRWRDAQVSEVVQQIRWPIMGGVLNQGNLVIERFLASFLPAGLVSAIVYARRVFSAADSILLGGVTTAFLPRLSTQFTQNRIESFKKSIVLSLKLTSFIAIPLTVSLIVLSESVIRLLFQRGAFDPETTRITAQLFSLYLLGILPTAMRRVFISAHYAMFDTKTPFIMLAISLGLSAVLYVALFFAFGAAGLAVAMSITRLIVALLLAYFVVRRIGRIDMGAFYKLAAKVLVASFGMGVLLYALQGVEMPILNRPGLIERGLQLGVVSLLGLVVFALMLFLLRVQETEQALEMFRLRFRKGSGE